MPAKALFKTPENNRQAKFYSITKRGLKQLARETEDWEREVNIMNLRRKMTERFAEYSASNGQLGIRRRRHAHTSAGFRTEHTLKARLSRPRSRYPDNRRIAARSSASCSTACGALPEGSVLLIRLIAKLLYEITPLNPLTFVAVLILLPEVALSASYIPARRATRVDPIVALRYE